MKSRKFEFFALVLAIASLAGAALATSLTTEQRARIERAVTGALPHQPTCK